MMRCCVVAGCSGLLKESRVGWRSRLEAARRFSTGAPASSWSRQATGRGTSRWKQARRIDAPPPTANGAVKRSSEFVRPTEANTVNRSVGELWKPLAFTLGVAGASFGLAYIVDADRRKPRPPFPWKALEDGQTFRFSYTFNRDGELSTRTIERRQSGGERDVSWRHFWHGLFQDRAAAVVAEIILLNAAVLCAWKVNRLRPTMLRYFTNSYFGEKMCSPMLLSVFSHYSVLHLAVNMWVLSQFSAPVMRAFLGVDQFVAFYLTAGVCSSLVSVAHKALIRSSVGALGASGAILAVLVYACMRRPEMRLQIIFVPFFNFSAQNAVVGIVAFDAIGLLLRFRLFDHAAHLGGSLFAVWYAMYGQRLLWDGPLRPFVVRKWNRLKTFF